MPLSLKTSDRWFVAILPAVLLASLFWFAFASPKRTHIVAAQTEIESLGGLDWLAERNHLLKTEKTQLLENAPARNRTPDAAAAHRAASPVLALSAARNAFRQAGLQIAGETLRKNQPSEWTLSLIGSFAEILQALELLSGPDYPELSVVSVSWTELRAGNATAVWQIRIVL